MRCEQWSQPSRSLGGHSPAGYRARAEALSPQTRSRCVSWRARWLVWQEQVSLWAFTGEVREPHGSLRDMARTSALLRSGSRCGVLSEGVTRAASRRRGPVWPLRGGEAGGARWEAGKAAERRLQRSRPGDGGFRTAVAVETLTCSQHSLCPPRVFTEPPTAGPSRARRPSLSPAPLCGSEPHSFPRSVPHIHPEPECPVFFLLCGPPGAPGLATLTPGLAVAGLSCLVVAVFLSTRSSRPVVCGQAKGLGMLVDALGDNAHPAPAPAGAGRGANCHPAPRCRPERLCSLCQGDAAWSMGQHLALCRAKDTT